MARTPDPWYWKARKGWYVTVGGHRHLLARGPEAATRAEARKAFHRLMADGRVPAPASAGLSVADLFGLFLEDFRGAVARGERAEVTGAGYFRFLAAAGAAFGSEGAATLAPHRVKRWAEVQGWGPTTMRNAMTAVKTAFAWGVRMGHLEASPIKALEKPRARRREAVLSDEQFRTILAAVKDRAFRDLLVALRETGARPGELFAVTAADLDPARRMAVLRRHKTAGKVGRPRVIYLSERAAALFAERAALFPDGPIFRNARGGPWNRFITKNRFHRLRAKLGFGGEATAYSLRHQYITDGLEAGVPIATMAQMVGHEGTRMIDQHYSHLEERHAHLHDAADRIARARGDGVEPPPSP
jgi:integrase